MPASEKPLLNVRKYPNRRLYDTTRSRHVTADELYDLIRLGHEVVVTDSRTGQDITNYVLTQLILERDPPKLEIFPARILHEAIRANQQMWGAFVEQWLAQAARAFASYPKRLGRLMEGAASLDPLAWGRTLKQSVGQKGLPANAAAPEPQPPSATEEEIRNMLLELRQRVSSLGAELRKIKPGSVPRRSKRQRSK